MKDKTYIIIILLIVVGGIIMTGIVHDRIVASRDKGLAVDWNADHEITGDVDMDQHSWKNQVIENLGAFPAGPVEGQIIYRTDEHKLYVYINGEWFDMVVQGFRDIVENGTRVLKTNFLGIAAVNMYSIPAGKVLYITHAYINWNARAVLVNENIFFYLDDTGNPILKINVHAVDNDHDTLSAPYPLPLRIVGPGILRCISSDADLDGIVGFLGYLVDA